MAKFFTQQEIEESITLAEVAATVEEVTMAHNEGKIVMPANILLDLSEAGLDSKMNGMPVYIGSFDIAGLKWAGSFTSNTAKGLPNEMATIILNDPRNGMVVAVMDGACIANMRIAAVGEAAAENTASIDIAIAYKVYHRLLAQGKGLEFKLF